MMTNAARAIMVEGTGKISRTARTGAPLARIAALLTLGLMLGACSKCDVPTPWEHSSAGSVPAACHSEPAPH
jgi:hypothetical protein